MPSGSAGSTVVESAMTSTSPVFASSTTALAHSASCSAARAPIVSWANHWASLSRVRRRSAPSTAGTSSSGALGMRMPSAPTSKVRVPGVPVMTSSWLSSRPSSGVPSAPMNPTMLPATEPLGYTRRSTGSASSPGTLSAMAASRISGVTERFTTLYGREPIVASRTCSSGSSSTSARLASRESTSTRTVLRASRSHSLKSLTRRWSTTMS